MPRCPNGHEQRLGLACGTCGADVTYSQSLPELLDLPEVRPDYGRVSILSIGHPGLGVRADFLGEISIGQDDAETSTNFTVGAIRGGSWLDYTRKHADRLRTWLSLMGISKSADRFIIMDTTSPLSVLVLSALPSQEHTAVIALMADRESTPVEQNTSYVAVSLALKKGLPVVGLSEAFERDMLYFVEDRGFTSGEDALARLLGPLVAAGDDFMDLLERDAKLGIKMHSLSAIMAGSKAVFGIASNAFMAQTYGVSIEGERTDYKTVHSLVFTEEEERAEFERGFGVFRKRRFKTALSAEVRFHRSGAQLYDMITIYGMDDEAGLQAISEGYQAIVRNMPDLRAGAA